jgi:alanine-synthesizing transaminase
VTPIRYAGRMAFSLPENPLARLEAEKRAAGQPILDLTVSNPTAVGLDYPADRIATALAHPAVAGYDPSPRGLPAARAAVRGDYLRRGARLADDQLLLTASSSESYSLLFKLFGEPGDVVLVPEPSYPLFAHLAGLEGLATRPYRLAYDGRWHLGGAPLDFTDVAAVVVVNPNNPTGSYIAQPDLLRLATLAAEHGVPLIVDEVFADYPHAVPADAVTAAAALDLPSLTFSLGGLSKSCGLPQMKLGFLAATGPDAARAITRLEWVADTYLSVGAPVQHALPTLLSLGAEIRARVQARVAANLGHLRAAIRPDSPCTLLPCEAGWSAILRLPAARTDEEWALALLRDRDVLVQPGYFFDLALGSTLVLSLLPPPDRFVEGIRRVSTEVDTA